MSKTFHILIVDDEPADQYFLRRAVESGIPSHCSMVNNVRQAMAYLEGTKTYADFRGEGLPDLILLDLKMPGQPGLDILDFCRKHAKPELQNIPIVVVSGCTETFGDKPFVADGAQGVFQKPVDKEKFLGRLRELLGVELST